jgi:hypothetical protein
VHPSFREHSSPGPTAGTNQIKMKTEASPAAGDIEEPLVHFKWWYMVRLIQWHLTEELLVPSVLICQRFETEGSLGRRVKCRRVPQPRWVGARPSTKGGRKAAGDGRERGGNPAAFVFVPRPGRVRLQ